MKIYFPIITLFLSLTFGGCKSQKSVQNRWDSLPNHHLTAEIIHSELPIYNTRFIILLENDFSEDKQQNIILQTAHNGNEFSLFSLHDTDLVYVSSFLHLGKGPRELTAALIYYLPEYNTLVLAGYNPRGKFITIPLNNIDHLLQVNSWEINETDLLYLSHHGLPINLSTYLVTLANEEEMFSIYDASNNSLTRLNMMLPNQHYSISLPEVKSRIFPFYVKKRPHHNQFVYSFENSPNIKIFSLRNNEITSQITIDDQLPKCLDDGMGRIVRDPSNQLGMRIEVSEKWIYFGDLKLTEREFPNAKAKNGYPANCVKEILVADWEGSPQQKYLLDYPVLSYAIDPNDEYLYAFAYDVDSGEEKFVRFKLP